MGCPGRFRFRRSASAAWTTDAILYSVEATDYPTIPQSEKAYDTTADDQLAPRPPEAVTDRQTLMDIALVVSDAKPETTGHAPCSTS